MLTYQVQLEAQAEGGYTATVPSLPGCISEGETIQETLTNVKDAIEGYVQVLIKHNRAVPIESSYPQQVNVFSTHKQAKQPVFA